LYKDIFIKSYMQNYILKYMMYKYLYLNFMQSSFYYIKKRYEILSHQTTLACI